ncbi:DUF1462 family protein [Terrilactibacillus laevilacticus]|uniref:DUF1462 family protein n=1 Tax=Terrilactibacillus laevilacticus TaxID=1380157 RepID=A0ABW5PSP4_9BACI|nr:DUF1462 family protein [Terrilactibacillus laevilacticus]
MELTVYGSEARCSSCVQAPSSRETMEWLEAAIGRKFTNTNHSIRYVDIYSPITEQDKKYTEKIINDELFFPLIVANDTIIGEGIPNLKKIFQYIEKEEGLSISE